MTLRIVHIAAILSLFLLTGCGGSQYQYHHVFPQTLFGETSADNSATIRTKLLDHYGGGGYTHEVYDSLAHWEEVKLGSDENTKPLPFSAYYKRKAALITGRSTISYGLVAYNHNYRDYELNFMGIAKFIPPKPTILWATQYDGVSNILYNVSYIFSIPAKLIHGTILAIKKEHYGFSDWVWMLSQLIVGLVLAIVMLFLGTVIGIVCHPFETLSNLTVNLVDIWESGPGSGWFRDTAFEFLGVLSPFTYWRVGTELLPVSVLGSLWDLVFGAILGPLVDILGLFFP